MSTPTITKEAHARLLSELHDRQRALDELIMARPLKGPSEGCAKRRHWVAPESRCAFRGTPVEIRMALEDFKSHT